MVLCFGMFNFGHCCMVTVGPGRQDLYCSTSVSERWSSNRVFSRSCALNTFKLPDNGRAIEERWGYLRTGPDCFRYILMSNASWNGSTVYQLESCRPAVSDYWDSQHNSEIGPFAVLDPATRDEYIWPGDVDSQGNGPFIWPVAEAKNGSGSGFLGDSWTIWPQINNTEIATMDLQRSDISEGTHQMEFTAGRTLHHRGFCFRVADSQNYLRVSWEGLITLIGGTGGHFAAIPLVLEEVIGGVATELGRSIFQPEAGYSLSAVGDQIDIQGTNAAGVETILNVTCSDFQTETKVGIWRQSASGTPDIGFDRLLGFGCQGADAKSLMTVYDTGGPSQTIQIDDTIDGKFSSGALASGQSFAIWTDDFSFPSGWVGSPGASELWPLYKIDGGGLEDLSTVVFPRSGVHCYNSFGVDLLPSACIGTSDPSPCIGRHACDAGAAYKLDSVSITIITSFTFVGHHKIIIGTVSYSDSAPPTVSEEIVVFEWTSTLASVGYDFITDYSSFTDEQKRAMISFGLTGTFTNFSGVPYIHNPTFRTGVLFFESTPGKEAWALEVYLGNLTGGLTQGNVIEHITNRASTLSPSAPYSFYVGGLSGTWAAVPEATLLDPHTGLKGYSVIAAKGEDGSGYLALMMPKITTTGGSPTTLREGVFRIYHGGSIIYETASDEGEVWAASDRFFYVTGISMTYTVPEENIPESGLPATGDAMISLDGTIRYPVAAVTRRRYISDVGAPNYDNRTGLEDSSGVHMGGHALGGSYDCIKDSSLPFSPPKSNPDYTEED